MLFKANVAKDRVANLLSEDGEARLFEERRRRRHQVIREGRSKTGEMGSPGAGGALMGLNVDKMTVGGREADGKEVNAGREFNGLAEMGDGRDLCGRPMDSKPTDSKPTQIENVED
ncbi:hypothetical protein MLD38_036934 [Melastoma candidum]|uniref:Uncharacterized protein n=1 Tax=Melastoma candidum TaxID=119954 RepID=A0ACB9LLL8_9MYRT|nr:hypothetical protein MLD38_036934 [Melastoma candidum]